MSKSIRNFAVLVSVLALGFGASFAEDAVFDSKAQTTVQQVNIKPAESAEAKATNTLTESETLSNEKFKSAVNNLESAQVDVREQLAVHRALVEEKEVEVASKKAELANLKKEYAALQKKMNNIEKMKKMLNNNIM